MYPMVNSISRQSPKFGAHLLRARRIIALAICTLYLALGGAIAFSGLRLQPIRPMTASTAWAGKPIPMVEANVAFRPGVSNASLTDGGPTVP
jgi:hypothetical protein